MLPRIARLTQPNDFASTTKNGIRLSSPSLVTYLYLSKEDQPAKCGLIISKNAGGSVVRHKIARQIRHSLQEHLATLPNGALLVVRALPNASRSKGRDISSEIAGVLPQLIKKVNISK